MNVDIVQIILQFFGGIALFIFGMNMMSGGMQKATGAKMKAILGALTKNPLIGLLVGAAVTAVLQASSATTIIAVGFVSAGLMSLPQGISIILGANIGTTLTAQLVAFKLGDYIWAIVFIGFLLNTLSKKEMFKNLGQAVLGFGILFVGMNQMGSVMAPLAQSETFMNMLTKVSAVPIVGFFFGMISTGILQSSSVTVAILQNLASQPVTEGATVGMLSLAQCMPILLGDNIGSTFPTIFACVGQNKSAKRATAAHIIFNISVGTILMILLDPFTRFIEFVSPKGAPVEIVARQLANAHTSFNALGCIIWLPLIYVLVKIVKFIFPGEDSTETEAASAIYLDKKVIDKPFVAMHLVEQEMCRVFDFASSMIDYSHDAIMSDNQEAISKVYKIEDKLDVVQDEIVKYLSSMLARGVLSKPQRNRASVLMKTASYEERIGDCCINICKQIKIKSTNGYKFSDAAKSELTQSIDLIKKMHGAEIAACKDSDNYAAKTVLDMENEINDLEEKLRLNHLQRLSVGKCSPELTVIYTDILHNIERIGDSCAKIITKCDDFDQLQIPELQTNS